MEIFAEQSDYLCFSPNRIVAYGYWFIGERALKISHLAVLLEIFIFFSDSLRSIQELNFEKNKLFCFCLLLINSRVIMHHSKEVELLAFRLEIFLPKICVL